jgi:SAM-dependent methyltransferase
VSKPSKPADAFADDSRYHAGGYYRAPRLELMQHLPPASSRILDIGCGGAALGGLLKDLGAEEVAGVELDPRAAEIAREHIDAVHVADIESWEPPYEEGRFDCVICGDVLEHLRDPWAALAKLGRLLRPNGAVVASLPNVGFYGVIFGALHGRWEYVDAGILDRTHLRFFTGYECAQLAIQAGLDVELVQPLNVMGEHGLPRDADGYVEAAGLRVGPLDDGAYSRLRTYQYLLRARRPVPVEQRLDAAGQSLRERDPQRALQLAEACAEANDARTNDGEIHTLQAEAYAGLGRADDAHAHYEQVLNSDPDHVRATAGLGVLLLTRGRVQEAKPLIQKAYQQDEGDGRALAAMALLAYAGGRQTVALDLFARAMELEPHDDLALANMMRAAAALDRYAEVLPLVNSYIARFPFHGEIRFQHAQIVLDQGDAPAAREHLAKLSRMFPGNSDVAALKDRAEQTAS